MHLSADLVMQLDKEQTVSLFHEIYRMNAIVGCLEECTYRSYGEVMTFTKNIVPLLISHSANKCFNLMEF